MQRVLVTGAAGLLGVEVVREARARGVEVVALDDASAGTWDRLDEFDDDAGVERVRADVTSPARMRRAAGGRQADAVVHLAAKHFIPYCAAHPHRTWRTNVEGTRAVLDALPAIGATAFLLASTADVYAWAPTALAEDAALSPTTAYGRSKVAAEDLVRAAREEMPSCALGIVRPFNLYGARPTVAHLLPEVIRQAREGGTLHLGNLDSVRDYVYVHDAARAVLDLLERRFADVVNLGTGHGCDGHEIVRTVGACLGRELSVQCSPSRLRAVDRPYLVADPSRARSLLPWWPATSLAHGVELVVGAADAPSGAGLGPAVRVQA